MLLTMLLLLLLLLLLHAWTHSELCKLLHITSYSRAIMYGENVSALQLMTSATCSSLTAATWLL
jgi:hypothetical protein